MSAPLEGVRVLEVANWLAAPAAATLMADLGADVIKVEPPGGDVLRHFDMVAYGFTQYTFPTNCVFELDNRGKRSIVVDLDRPGGPELVHRLLAKADVLILNLTPKRRARYRLTEEAVRAVNPTLVYASLTGYGTQGPDADRPGFDYAASGRAPAS
jgi:crotonobetainyl-CoA:carnitine CoA-transferase CaiB-like acyl-CoA transferase